MALNSEIDSGFEVRKGEVHRDGQHDFVGKSNIVLAHRTCEGGQRRWFAREADMYLLISS